MAKKMSKLEKKQDKQAKYIVGIMFFILIVIIFSALFVDISRTFGYNGMKFSKEKYGNILIYKHSYYFINDGEQYLYNLYLRNDPRKNDVSFEGTDIFFNPGLIYLSINTTNLEKCENSSIAISEVAGFLKNNLLDVKSASPDKAQANKTGYPYANCNTHPSNTVILFEEGNKTEIVQDKLCYTVKVANCEILEASEEFIVQAILDGRDRRAKLGA
jgi:hypothetical protein